MDNLRMEIAQNGLKWGGNGSTGREKADYDLLDRKPKGKRPAKAEAAELLTERQRNIVNRRRGGG